MAAKQLQAREQIAELIERYEGLGERGRKGLNEANTRKDFILPLFAALGWHTEDSSEVSEEVRVGRDWADYAFKLGGITRFYLEAKAVHVDLEETQWAEQAVSYAYNKGASWAVLTNFEGLKLFNAEWDFVDVQRLRVLDLRYTDYLEAFDDLWALSRERVKEDGLRKTFERRGGAVKKRLKVDEHLFGLLKEWRLKLIQLFVNYQPPDTPLKLGQIDEAVQRILDRLIFIRTLEDRQIEDPILSPIHHRRTGSKVSPPDGWTALREQFRRLDSVYNSNLFAEHLADTLKGDESAFLPMLSQLYSPDGSAYRFDFSAIEADVLGRVYEQYLGHVIQTTKSPVKVGGNVYLPGMQPANAETVEVVSKQAKRKQQGIYYTPKYIVDYIVEQTLGRLLEERGGDKEFVDHLTVLDPACGSGSFLIAAYERLLKYYAEVRQVPGGAGNLSQDERVEILLRHIYGVDLDPQAVEITRLNLLLRALREPKLLPEMDGNIVRGNSLVGDLIPGPSPSGRGETADLPPDSHPLNWAERFPQVMNRGGFDIVIGNPPYGIVFDELMKQYLEKHYPSFVRNNDTYVAFVHRAIQLLRIHGRFGFIVPNTFLTGPYFDDLKKYILDWTFVESIVDFGINQVFETPNVFSALLFLGRTPELANASPVQTRFVKVADLHSFPNHVAHETIGQAQVLSLQWTPTNKLASRLFGSGFTLDTLAWIKDVGLNYWTEGRGKKRGGGIGDRVQYEGPEQHADDIPFLKGRDIERYSLALSSHWLRHNYETLLDPDVDILRYSPEFLERPKIIYRQTADRIIAAIEPSGMLIDKTLHCIVVRDEWETKLDLRYLLGLLNSRLLTYLYQTMAREEGRTFAQVKVFRMKQMPIRVCDLSDPTEVALHDRVVAHVERLLALHQQRADITPQTDAYEQIEREIAAEDSALDQLVYQLYGLTEEEIAIVEGKN